MDNKVGHDSSSARAEVAPNVILDGRLALYHKTERWLTMADLHFGYELSQRAAGSLFPLWGMQTIEARMMELLEDYQPNRLILLGDLVHNRAGGAGFAQLVELLAQKCEVILIAGNHDRYLSTTGWHAQWQCGEFHFHHGHCEIENPTGLQIVGHHHPAGIIRDGAGLRLKLPAFIQTPSCWIMPAFSPWAGGTEWQGDEQTITWLCSPRRILPKVSSPKGPEGIPDR